MSEAKRLPESELDIMLVVWAEKGPVAAPAILAGMGRPLTASALHSYLKRLEEKGFLRCGKEGKVNQYTALVTKEEYQVKEGKTMLGKLYAGSLKRFAASLYDGGSLGRAEVEELRQYLDSLDGGEAH